MTVYTHIECSLNFISMFLFLCLCFSATWDGEKGTKGEVQKKKSDEELSDRLLALREILDKRALTKRVRSEIKNYLSAIGLTNDLLDKAISLKNVPAEMGRLAKSYRTAKRNLGKKSAAKKQRARAQKKAPKK